jgi:hypothetical protein
MFEVAVRYVNTFRKNVLGSFPGLKLCRFYTNKVSEKHIASILGVKFERVYTYCSVEVRDDFVVKVEGSTGTSSSRCTI